MDAKVEYRTRLNGCSMWTVGQKACFYAISPNTKELLDQIQARFVSSLILWNVYKTLLSIIIPEDGESSSCMTAVLPVNI